MINAYLRADGRKGIRNTVVVAYLVECAHHVSREIYYPFREQGAHLIGFPGCFPNVYSHKMMERLCTHPNVGAALLVSLGCEGFNKGKLQETIRKSGRPVKLIEIQGTGGTRKTIAEGKAWIEQTLNQLESTPRANMTIDEHHGKICIGSDELHVRQNAGGSISSTSGGTVSRTLLTGTAVEIVSCPASSTAIAVSRNLRLPLPTGGTHRPRKRLGRPGMPAGLKALSTRCPSTRKTTDETLPPGSVASTSMTSARPSNTKLSGVGRTISLVGFGSAMAWNEARPDSDDCPFTS